MADDQLHLYHDASHFERRLRRFEAAIVFRAQTACAGLLFVLEEKNLMDDRNFVTELDVHECPADGVANVGGVRRLAAQDNTKDASAQILKVEVRT